MTNPFDVTAIQVLLDSRALVFDALGLVAGSLVAVSGMPKVLQRLRDRRAGRCEFSRPDLLRDAAQALGNTIWVIVGANLGLVSVTLFCSVQAVLMTLLVSLNLQARGRDAQPGWAIATPARDSARGDWPDLR